MSRHLPPRPNLEYLKNQAKELLPSLQHRNPASKLADAQHAIAVEYGFANWSSLKAHVEALTHRSPFVGTWVIDRAKSRRQPDTSFERAALQFAVLDETVTITDVVEDASGRKDRTVNTIVADGREHGGERGYGSTSRWRGAHVLEIVSTKDGREVSRMAYTVSRDGTSLTVSATAAAHDGYPAVEQLSVFNRVARGRDAIFEESER